MVLILIGFSAAAETPFKIKNGDSLYLVGRDSALFRWGSDLVARNEGRPMHGRIQVVDFRGLRDPLRILSRHEYRTDIEDLTPDRIPSEAGTLIDAMFPRLSWTRYRQILSDLETWSRESPRDRRIWRLTPRESVAFHALWVVDLKSGFAVVLRLP